MLTSTLIYNLTRSIDIRSDSEPDNPDVVKMIFSEIATGQYFNVALASALVYHSLITMDQEVKYFWVSIIVKCWFRHLSNTGKSKPLNSVSLIYFANRYVGLLGTISFIVYNGLKESIMSCESSFWMVSLCNLVTIVLIDYILVVRVLALYHQDRTLAIFLKFLIGLEAAIDLSILVYSGLFDELAVGELAEGITVCGSFRDPPEVLDIISWIVPMTFGLLLLSLALYKAAEYWRLSFDFKGFYLVKVLIRDQGLYYGCVILCCILKIGAAHALQLNEFVANLLNAAGSPTLLCILGGQLLINLKEAGELGVNGGTNYRSKTMSDIEFAEIVAAPREEGQTSENAEDVPSFEGNSSS